jgi:hypothetical protein
MQGKAREKSGVGLTDHQPRHGKLTTKPTHLLLGRQPSASAVQIGGSLGVTHNLKATPQHV